MYSAVDIVGWFAPQSTVDAVGLDPAVEWHAHVRSGDQDSLLRSSLRAVSNLICGENVGEATPRAAESRHVLTFSACTYMYMGIISVVRDLQHERYGWRPILSAGVDDCPVSHGRVHKFRAILSDLAIQGSTNLES
jgi:hypothetical protein